MISCPNCGGNVLFDIPSQKLKCDHCHELFEPTAFEDKTSDAEEEKAFDGDYEVTVFTCTQCGGEILSTDNAAAGFCSFCGASTILYSRISHEHRPGYIIPFQKTKEDCKQAYASMMKRAIFAPKELKDPKNIDSFRGIYMPYWAYYLTQQGPLAIPAQKVYRSGNYMITDHYNLTGELDAYYKGLSYDASSSFADSISEALAPYDVKNMKAFTPAYLSGFYADTSDVPSSVYEYDAHNTAFENTFKQVSAIPAYASYSIELKKDSASLSKVFNTQTEAVDSALFPVWFMSYRHKDRVAYATVNGQTGKVVADLPVDPGKFAAGSLLLAIPIFILLACFVTFMPSSLLILSCILAVITSIIYTTELSAINKRDSFADDRGKNYKLNPNIIPEPHIPKQVAKPKKKKCSIFSKFMLGYYIVMLLVQLCSLIGIFSDSGTQNATFILWILLLITMIITIAIGSRKIQQLPAKQSVLGYVLCTIAICIGFAISTLRPIYDLYYYIGAIVCLLSVIISLADIIRYYNVLSTRRLPQFDKQGGDNRA